MNKENLNILLVDDDEKFLFSLAERIKLKGFNTLTAVDGQKAVDMAKSNKIYMAIIDQRLPDTEGVSLVAELKKIDASMKTVLLTAHGDDKIENASKALETAYFEKSNMGGFWEFLMHFPIDTLNILLVDDDEMFLKSMAERVRIKGFAPLLAGTGAEAVAEAAGKKIHVAVVDQRLPDMEGLQVVAKLREIDPDVQTVLLTAYGDDKLKEATRALEAGYYDKADMNSFWGFIKSVMRKFENSMAAVGMATGGDHKDAMDIEPGKKK
jgi:ActR/RegA family two-component response regulator